jgi:UDP-N-acetyl-D-mannosaminuronic acid dehydrogenase
VPNKIETACVVGLGYIGLPTAAILASRYVRVIGVDVDPRVVETVNNGEIHIVEPDLHHLVRGVVDNGYLTASLTPRPADVFVIAVPTPFNPDRTADLTYVRAAVDALAPVLAKGNLVILESTSPVGTTEAICQRLGGVRPDLVFPDDSGRTPDVHVAYCPERVLPGKILTELVFNDRSIGGRTPGCSDLGASFYSIFVRGECIKTDSRTAELVKLSENAFRDVNIALANELSAVCEKLSIDVWKLVELANLHPRVNILQPGPGVGGHCIAVDPWFIIESAPDDTPLLQAARAVNEHKPLRVIDAITEYCEASGYTGSIACLGLTYKPDVDDLRESPALQIALELNKRFPDRVVCVEPHVDPTGKALQSAQLRLASAADALATCDVLIVLVGHRAFRSIDRVALADKKIFDCVGFWR